LARIVRKIIIFKRLGAELLLLLSSWVANPMAVCPIGNGIIKTS